MSELESSLSNLERDLSDVNTNYVALRKNHLELLELKSLLIKTETFLSETSFNISSSSSRPADDEARSECSHPKDVVEWPFFYKLIFILQIFLKVGVSLSSSARAFRLMVIVYDPHDRNLRSRNLLMCSLTRL